MKKVLFSIFVLLYAAGMSAETLTAFATVQLKSESNATNDMYIVEASDYAEGIDVANSAAFFENTTNTANVNVFARYADKKYAQFAAKTIKNLPLGIITNREAAAKQNYKFIFSNLQGRSLKLYDAVTGTVTTMTEGGEYAFTVNTTNCPSYVAETNVTIADRFIVEMEVPDFEICHRFGALQVTGYKDGKVIVRNAAGQEVINKVVATYFEEISLAGLPAGKYTVELNDGAKVLTIKVQ